MNTFMHIHRFGKLDIGIRPSWNSNKPTFDFSTLLFGFWYCLIFQTWGSKLIANNNRFYFAPNVSETSRKEIAVEWCHLLCKWCHLLCQLTQLQCQMTTFFAKLWILFCPRFPKFFFEWQSGAFSVTVFACYCDSIFIFQYSDPNPGNCHGRSEQRWWKSSSSLVVFKK